INKYMEMLHTRKNHVIFSKMVDLYFDEKRGGNIDILKKVKDAENMIDIVDYNIRVRLAKELKPTKSELESLKKLTPEKMNSVIYRYKQRVSLYVYQKNNEFVRIDLTLVKMNKLINRLDRSAPRYELEMEYGQSTDQNKKP